MGFIEIDGELVAVREGVSRIGRSAAAEVRFEDPSVSNRHALLVRDGDVVRVLDDRGQGVHVNGLRITAKRLQDGDVIGIGRHELRYVATVPAEAELLAG